MDTGTRTGITYLANDGSDAVTAYRTSIRNTVAALEAKGTLYSQTVLGSRPAAGVVGRFWKNSGSLNDGILYYDNGSAWEAVGAGAPTDGSAATPSLRTLGSGSTQAAAGNHGHAIGAITGTGNSVTKNVGTAAGTVAAGNHTHPGTVSALYVYKPLDTSRAAVTALADDPDLTVALPAGTWMVDIDLAVAGGSGGDVHVDYTFDGTATTRQTWILGPSLSTTTIANTSMNMQSTTGGAGWIFGTDAAGDVTVRIRTVQVVTVSGAFTVRWAQTVSSGTATAIRAGSHVVALAIA